MILRCHPVVVPKPGEGPHLIQGQELAPGYAPALTPLLSRLFRLEEQDGRSRENKIVVPLAKREQEMDDLTVPEDHAIPHPYFQG